MKKNRKLLLGTIAALVGVALFFSALPALSATTTSPHLSLKYRSVSNSGDCLDYGLGAPCTNCVLPNTNPSVCTDILTAVGAKQTWHAYYYSGTSATGVNIGEKSGTLYPGQSLVFFFGLKSKCSSYYQPLIVKIVGPYNSVEIGYSGCG
jgi:hypothetical protein